MPPVGRTFRGGHRGGFTLVEVLVATALTLFVMAITVNLFAFITENVSNSRAMIETNDRLRATHQRLVRDLRYITAPMLPPLDPEADLGYLEFREGAAASQIAAIDSNSNTDTTVTDSNDILMFTTRSFGEPFVGRYVDTSNNNTVTQSQLAEVAWFVRGTTLYRRVLLVVPGSPVRTQSNLFYRRNDVSVHQIGGNQDPDAFRGGGPVELVPNSLGDLTKRENRYAHRVLKRDSSTSLFGFPHDIDRWGQGGLPTLQESSSNNWPFPYFGTAPSSPVSVAGIPVSVAQTDYWTNPFPWTGVDPQTGNLAGFSNSPRIAEDVILTNVIGFDVKAWDPLAPIFTSGGVAVAPGDSGYGPLLVAWRNASRPEPGQGTANDPSSLGAWVNLNYAGNNNDSHYSGPGNYLPAGSFPQLSMTYDTWSTHYERDGIDQDNDGTADEATDGFDNNNSGGIDDASEREAPPPYATPLRGIQIRIRVFEPDSRQIREVTVVQDFLPE